MNIRISQQVDNTMVWYLNDGGCAEVAYVAKGWAGWSMSFKGKTVDGYRTKASALADAKKALKKYQGGRK